MNIGLFVKDFAIGKKFSKNGLPTKSGAEFHAENHALQLIKRGHHVTIFAKKRMWATKARENINGIDLVRLHEPFRGLEILIRLFTTHRDIDCFYILGTPKFAVWAILYAKFMHKPVTLALTGIAEKFDKNKNWRNKILASCDRYLAMSQEIYRAFVDSGQIEKEKVIIQPQGIDTAKYPHITYDEKIKLRRKYKIDEQALVLLFCARVVVNKGIKVVEAIWPKLHQEFPTAKLLIVGGGDNTLLEELRTISKKQDNSIEVIGEVESTRDYYQISDVYIFPSHHEGLPNTLMEAMSTGLPAVVSDIGGCEDLIQNGVNGYRLEKNDVEGFYRRTRELFLDKEERKNFGKNASHFVKTHCDFSCVIDELVDVLGRPVRGK